MIKALLKSVTKTVIKRRTNTNSITKVFAKETNHPNKTSRVVCLGQPPLPQYSVRVACQPSLLGGLLFIKYCEILFFLIKEIEKIIFKKILNIKTNEALESNLVL
jgi:hypothetical protein